MRLLLCALALLLAPAAALAQGTGTLAGQVLDESGEPMTGATVRIEGTSLGAAADIDGNYRIIGVPVGTYDVTAQFIGYETVTQAGVAVAHATTRTLDFALVEGDVRYIEFGCYFGPPIINRDPFASRVVSGEDLRNLPVGR